MTTFIPQHSQFYPDMFVLHQQKRWAIWPQQYSTVLSHNKMKEYIQPAMLYVGPKFLTCCLKPFSATCSCICNFHPQFALPVMWSATSECSSCARWSHLLTFGSHTTSCQYLLLCSLGVLDDVFLPQVMKQVCYFYIQLEQFSCILCFVGGLLATFFKIGIMLKI